jgi:hypothetical protein
MRKLVLSLVSIVAISAFVVACGDDDVQPDKGPVFLDNGVNDGGVGDQIVLGDVPTVKPDAGGKCLKATLGKTCTSTGGECGDGHICLLTSSDGKTGVCTCDCTTDDSSTPLVNEDSCPDLSTSECGTITTSKGQSKMCFNFCKPTLGKNTCGGQVKCLPSSRNYIGGSLDKSHCFFVGGCAKDSDCPVSTNTTCDTVKKNCPTGEECLALVTGAVDGFCNKPGKCDTVSGICDVKPASLSKAAAKVGDACKSDVECAGNQICLQERDYSKICLARDAAGACTKNLGKEGAACTKAEECCSSKCTANKCGAGTPCAVIYRNGYCVTPNCVFSDSLTKFKCGAGSDCGILPGFCLKSCDITKAGDCRGNANDLWGDYECRSWNNLTFGGNVAASSTPVCEGGLYISCDFFKNNPSLDCSVFGDKTNTTKMSCRTLGNVATTDKYDGKGRCFDDTSSGTKVRNPLP